MNKQNKPMPPVDDPRYNRGGKRGKSYPFPPSSWNQQGDPGRGPYTPELGPEILNGALGGWSGTNDTDDA